MDGFWQEFDHVMKVVGGVAHRLTILALHQHCPLASVELFTFSGCTAGVS